MHPGETRTDEGQRAQGGNGAREDERAQALQAWNRRASAFVRENPGTVLLCAVAVGFVVGKIASRR